MKTRAGRVIAVLNRGKSGLHR